MEFKIECPWCNQHYSVDDSFIGQNVECSVCGKQFIVNKPTVSAQAIEKTTEYSTNQARNPEKKAFASKNNIRKVLIGCAFLIIVAFSICVVFYMRYIPEKEYKNGIKAYNEQRYEEAITHFQKAADYGHEKAKNEQQKTLAEINIIKGNKAFNEHRFEDAILYYKKATELGHPKAHDKQQNTLAEISYIKGEMAYEDNRLEEALDCYKKAADLGHLKAQNKYQIIFSQTNLNGGLKAIDEHRFEDAVKFLQYPASQGNSEAQFLLGTCYFNGEGVKKDADEAVKWFRKAAEQNKVEAQYKLGLCYLSGTGVAMREDEAIYWLKKAAEQGHSEAQVVLGDLYYKEGPNHDFYNAYKWYQNAGELAISSRAEKMALCAIFVEANSGDAKSQFVLYRLYNEGEEGITMNKNEALKWLRKSADSGYSEAQATLGIYTFLGTNGIQRNISEGINMIEKAANQGNSDAQYHLGEYYFADRQYKKAIPLLRAAGDNGNILAMKKLYECYREGIGVKENFSEAVKWLKKAQQAARKELYE